MTNFNNMTNKETKIFEILADEAKNSKLNCKHASCIVFDGKVIHSTICCNNERSKVGNCLYGSSHAEICALNNLLKIKRYKKYVL